VLRVDLRSAPGAPLEFAVRFDLPPRAVLGLFGPTGAGKTTLLRAVAGLQPVEGEVLLDGEDVRARSPWLRPVGWVPQRQGLIPHWTPEQHLRALGPALREDPGDALHRLELDELSDRPVRRLSFGERQRLALGRALFTRRPLLLLDEPFSALDAGTRLRMGDLLLEEVQRTGAVALLATHDLYEVQRLCSRLCLLRRGEMLAEGPTADLLREPPHARAAELLGYHLLGDGLCVHPAEALWQPAAGRVGVQGVVRRALPRDFGWRVELTTPDGRAFAADLPQGARPPDAGERVSVHFPERRLPVDPLLD